MYYHNSRALRSCSVSPHTSVSAPWIPWGRRAPGWHGLCSTLRPAAGGRPCSTGVATAPLSLRRDSTCWAPWPIRACRWSMCSAATRTRSWPWLASRRVRYVPHRRCVCAHAGCLFACVPTRGVSICMCAHAGCLFACVPARGVSICMCARAGCIYLHVCPRGVVFLLYACIRVFVRA